MISIYGKLMLEAKIPCILKDSCDSCTTENWCVWTTGDKYDGIKVISENNNSTVYEQYATSFCWAGNFFGGIQKRMTGIEMLEGGNSTIEASFKWNDYSYKQCTLR